MNGFSQDIDGKRPLPWKRKTLPSSLKADSHGIESKQQLIDNVEQMFRGFTDALYGDNTDQKYTRIVDLAMLRINSDLKGVDVKLADADSVTSAVEQMLEDAYNQDDSAKYADIVKKASSKVVEMLHDVKNQQRPAESSTQPETASAQKEQNTSRTAAVPALDITVSQQLKKINDAMSMTAVEMKQQFSLIDKMMKHMQSATEAKAAKPKKITQLHMQLEKIKSLQVAGVNVTDFKKHWWQRKATYNINIGEMKLSSKVIDRMTNDAAKSVVWSTAALKKHYDLLASAAYDSQSKIQEHSSRTLKLLSKVTTSKFARMLGKIFNWIYVYCKKKLGDPLIKLFKDWVWSFFPVSWKILWEKLSNPITSIFKEVSQVIIKSPQQILDAFFGMCRLVYKGLILTIRLIWFSMKMLFSGVLKAFELVVRGAVAALRIALKAFLNTALWIARNGARAVWWVARQTGRLVRYGFRKLGQTKFGQFVARGWKKVTQPFKAFGEKVSEAFGRMKEKIVAVKDKVFAKAKVVGDKIKTFATNVGTKVRTVVSSVIDTMKTKLSSVRAALKTKLSTALNKIPGMKFIKRWSVKIFTQIGKTLLKNKAKKNILSMVFRKIATALGKALAKLGIRCPNPVLAVIGLLWTYYDIKNTYEALKDMLKPLAEEAGYDISKPAWFEKFLWDHAKQIIFEGDPNGYILLLKQVLRDTIAGIMRDIKFWFISREKRQQYLEQRKTMIKRYSDPFNRQPNRRYITNIPAFLDKQAMRYQKIIDYAIFMKNNAQQIANLNDKFQDISDDIYQHIAGIEHLRFNQEISRDITVRLELQKEINEYRKHINEKEKEQEKFEEQLEVAMMRHMNLATQLIKWALLSGMGYMTDMHRRLYYYAYSEEPENDDATVVALYQEAVAGLEYINLLKHREEIQAQLKERIAEWRQFFSEYTIDYDRLKQLFHSYVEQEASIYDKAKKMLDKINNEEQQIGRDAEQVFENFYSGETSPRQQLIEDARQL